jgi:hypothetical protein
MNICLTTYNLFCIGSTCASSVQNSTVSAATAQPDLTGRQCLRLARCGVMDNVTFINPKTLRIALQHNQNSDPSWACRHVNVGMLCSYDSSGELMCYQSSSHACMHGPYKSDCCIIC